MQTLATPPVIFPALVPASEPQPVSNRSYEFRIDLRECVGDDDDEDQSDIKFAASRRTGDTVPLSEVLARLNG